MMTVTLDNQLVVALSSRALFDFEEENQVFEAENDAAYMKLQLDRLDAPARPGCAFPLVKKLLALNTPDTRHVEVIIVSRNDPVSGLRVFRSAQLQQLDLTRGVFTRGRPAYPYLEPLGAHLFLSAHRDDVRNALEAGYPAAQVYAQSAMEAERHPHEIRIAFDGDAVLFSDEAERVYQTLGLPAFAEHERLKAAQPLPPGPFKPLLDALHKLQQAIRHNSPVTIRTALVTARSAPAHERAIRTLMDWSIAVDEAMFLGGLPKGPFLREFEPDFFFDDQSQHCQSAIDAGPVGQVVAGMRNAVAQ
jgi:5'-nucleotidase